jgi:hypothetical protein
VFCCITCMYRHFTLWFCSLLLENGHFGPWILLENSLNHLWEI